MSLRKLFYNSLALSLPCLVNVYTKFQYHLGQDEDSESEEESSDDDDDDQHMRNGVAAKRGAPRGRGRGRGRGAGINGTPVKEAVEPEPTGRRGSSRVQILKQKEEERRRKEEEVSVTRLRL